MLEVNPYFDYNIDIKCLENNKYDSTIKKLYDFGYRTIAINQNLNISEVTESKKKNKKGQPRESSPDLVPTPYEIIPVKGCESMKILNRLTVEFAAPDVIQKATKSSNYKKYHIIAALPTTPAALMFTCNTFEADILCFNPLNKVLVRNRKLMNLLIERQYHFEIMYAPAIEDSTKRKNTIQISHVYHSLGKSRNIIISSGATNSLLLRGPYDIINLALIFGLNEQQAKDAITHCGRKVFLNSVGRRHGKTVMIVENIEEKIAKKPEKPSEISSDKPPVQKDISVIDLVWSDDEDEVIELDGPTPKKIKQ